MNTRPLLITRTSFIPTVSELLAVRRRDDMLLFIVIFVTAFSLTPVFILSGLALGLGLLLGLLGALAVALVIVRWPSAGFYFAAASALLIEEQPLTTAPVLTDHLYVFYWPSGLEGQIERPIGYMFIFIIMVLVCYHFIKRQKLLRGGTLFWPFLLYLLCVVGGILHGLTSGGDLKITVVEVRPFWYLFVSYLLGYNLVRHKRDIRTLFWLVIIVAGIKGVQGVYIYLVVLHGNLTGYDSIMAHEESFFFAAMLVLLILFYLHYRYRPQLYAALLVLPFVLVSLIANQRRTDYIALLVGFVMAWFLIFVVKPTARKMLIIIALIILILGPAYVAVFSNSTGLFAAPARAVVSVFSNNGPGSKADSNLYRTVEDADLIYTVKQHPVFGLGFGKPYSEPVPLTTVFPDIQAADIYYAYVPHNTIYWVWMRLGAVGFFAFWYLIGAIIVRGSQIVRQLKDQYLQLAAIYIIGITAMEIIVAFGDYQLFTFRNVIYVGLLVGVLMKLPLLDEKSQTIKTSEADLVLSSSIQGFQRKGANV